MSDGKHIRRLIDRFAGEESAASKKVFIAPVARDGCVRLRIAGVICTLAVEDSGFEGWGVFKAVSVRKARLIERARRSLVREYLDALPAVRLIIAAREGATRRCVLAHPAGSRVAVNGAVPVRLVEGVDLFRHIVARFDGRNFWYDRTDAGRDAVLAAYLRKALERDVETGALERRGLLPSEKRLYLQLLDCARDRREPPEQRRLRRAVEHAGGELDSYRSDGGDYNVTFIVDGERHLSRVRGCDLTVVSAGICLDEHDTDFDLQSLVSVLREAKESGELF